MPRALNATAASLLGFLHDGPQSGYDLLRTAERAIGDFWSLTRSQVYRELAAMADDGLVVAAEVGARDRRAYAVTDEGREAFRQWLSRLPAEEQIRYPLLLVLAFARHLPPGELAAFVAQHRAVHAARLEGYHQARVEALAAGARPVDLVTLDFGTRYETAVVEWFDALPAELREG
ncbi:PadR family transcriptional regulator [uncultured Pseudokineococcus sp.]|uniref:PadR family transcriptional regulator n=1 Tax=uncultured Pseudokineococcus sp. TaxID=1642928 RepID=UPI00263989FC|nr:PadR family transcriptional regulator [uncultured Pseudokineococcus sp.]